MERSDGITTTLYAGTLEAVAEPPNLSRNGSFETGSLSPDWIGSGTDVPVVQAGVKHSGSFAAQLGVDQPGSGTTTSVLAQTIAIPPGAASAVVTLWISTTVTTASSADQYVRAFIVQRGQEVERLTNQSFTRDNGSWRQISYNLHRRYNGQAVTLRFEVSSTNNLKRAFMQVDDVQVKACATELCNGDFEYGLYGWTPGGTIMPKALVLSRRTGAYGARVGSKDLQQPAGFSKIFQRLTITDTQAVQSVTVKFWYYLDAKTTDTSLNHQTVYVAENSCTNTAALQTLWTKADNDEKWHQATWALDSDTYTGRSIRLCFEARSTKPG